MNVDVVDSDKESYIGAEAISRFTFCKVVSISEKVPRLQRVIDKAVFESLPIRGGEEVFLLRSLPHF